VRKEKKKGDCQEVSHNDALAFRSYLPARWNKKKNLREWKEDRPHRQEKDGFPIEYRRGARKELRAGGTAARKVPVPLKYRSYFIWDRRPLIKPDRKGSQGFGVGSTRPRSTSLSRFSDARENTVIVMLEVGHRVGKESH